LSVRPQIGTIAAAGGYASFAAAGPRETCPLCRQYGSLLFSDLEDLYSVVDGRWAMLACGGCRIAWLAAPPPKSDFDKLYLNYFTHAPDEPDPGPKRTREKIKDAAQAMLLGLPFGHMPRIYQMAGALAVRIPRYRELLWALTQWLPRMENGMLLDVGCGNGFFLKRMRDLGWTVQGIDPDRRAVEQARSRFALDVVAAPFEEHHFPDDSFDAVVVSHVIEHVHDPVSLLRECRRILKPGGKLVVLTPNFIGLQGRWLGTSWAGIDCPRHMFLFSRRSLGRCCEIAGLRVASLRTTARGAKNFWQFSRERNNPGGPASKRKPLGLRMEAFFYDWIERSALLFWPDAGAEILLIAGK
jgi:2-polyprenyl-3-methyl-5-hydroxy-6-metoxy-1,4-benzoquinol methylase